jgi:DNA-binding transcriptional regulator YdaS (Cro superfamily)
MTQAQFSPIVGISKQQLNNVVMGRSRLSIRSALRVVTATGGEISLADIANWEPGEARD